MTQEEEACLEIITGESLPPLSYRTNGDRIFTPIYYRYRNIEKRDLPPISYRENGNKLLDSVLIETNRGNLGMLKTEFKKYIVLPGNLSNYVYEFQKHIISLQRNSEINYCKN